MEQLSLSEELIRIAQNDYMIDGNYLPDGRLLIFAVEQLEYRERMMIEYSQEINSLQDYIRELEDRIASEEFWKEMDNG